MEWTLLPETKEPSMLWVSAHSLVIQFLKFDCIHISFSKVLTEYIISLKNHHNKGKKLFILKTNCDPAKV
jgi:hypothetical protein